MSDSPTGSITPRLPLVGDGEDPRLEVLFDRMRSSGRPVANIQRALGHSPAVALAFADLGDAVRSVPWLAATDVELVILRVAVRTAAKYPFSHHVAPAREAGLTHEQLACIWGWEDADCFAPEQRLLLRVVDEIDGDAGLDVTTYEALAEVFPPRHIVELVALVGFYGLLARLTNSLGAPLDEGVQAVVAQHWRGSS